MCIRDRLLAEGEYDKIRKLLAEPAGTLDVLFRYKRLLMLPAMAALSSRFSWVTVTLNRPTASIRTVPTFFSRTLPLPSWTKAVSPRSWQRSLRRSTP